MEKQILGLVAETNPYHQGHRRIVKNALQAGKSLVVALSGSFVQRGRPAVLDKWRRAQVLVREGVDLVLEIPTAFVLQAADGFAQGAIQTLAQIPGLSGLSFGLEAPLPQGLVDQLEEPSLQEQIRAKIQKGASYRRAVTESLGIDLKANQILALHYLRAMRALSLDWTPFPLLRASSKEDPNQPQAKEIRKRLEDIPHNLAALSSLPYFSQEKDHFLSQSLDPLSDYLLYAHLLDGPALDQAFRRASHYEEGMEYRLLGFLEETKSLERAIGLAANKRQTRSRYRRLVLSALLQIRRDALVPIDFIRPLAFNEQGRKILRRVQVPVIQKDRSLLSPKAQSLFAITDRADRLAQAMQGQKPSDVKQTYYVP